MIGGSFRVRLSLWNATVLAVVLALFELTLSWGIRSTLAASVDRDLRVRARRFQGGGAPPPPAPPRRQRAPFVPPEEDGGPPGQPDDGPPGEDGPPDASPEGPGPGLQAEGQPEARPAPFPGAPPPRRRGPRGRRGMRPGQAEDEFDAEARRANEFLRPHFLTADGAPVSPPGGPSDAPAAWDPATVSAALQGRPTFSTILVNQERVRVLSVPAELPAPIAVLQMARPLGEYDRLWSSQLGILLGVLPLGLVAAIAGALFLADRALQPVRAVTRAAAEIGAEDLSRRLPVQGTDELAALASTFNAMIARLEAAFEQQRRFTADASHELRTPLARIKLTTSEALSAPQSPDEYRSALAVADRAADAMGSLIQQLLLLARADAGQLALRYGPTDLADVLREAIGFVERPGVAPIQLSLEPDPAAGLGAGAADLWIQGDPEHLCRVFINLLANAARHTPAAGRIQVTVRRLNRQEAEVSVADDGEGIAPEHLPHVFERFYRIDAARARAGGGSGLGLAISESVVHAHGGRIGVRSELGKGTVVTVILPLRTES